MPADSLTKMYTDAQWPVIYMLNRVDKENLTKQDTLVIPDKFETDNLQYAPFPYYVGGLKEINKIIFFSYPAQAFGAYEHGKLVRWGPTSLGRQKDQTPRGLFFTNWKAEETTSTVDDEWKLKWNFNIANKDGVGWHEYAMPGYPASHSCLRLMETDARYLYDWAEEWVMQGTDNIKAYGTPVIVYGTYPFGGPKPWYQLAANPAALDITKDALQKEAEPFIKEILQKQEQRAAVKSK